MPAKAGLRPERIHIDTENIENTILTKGKADAVDKIINSIGFFKNFVGKPSAYCTFAQYLLLNDFLKFRVTGITIFCLSL